MDGSRAAAAVPMMMIHHPQNGGGEVNSYSGGGGGTTNSGASWMMMMNEMRLGHQQLSRAEAAGTKFWIDVQQERQQQQASTCSRH